MYLKNITYLILFYFSVSFASHAELFSTSYISFEIPKNWKCISEGANWICHNSKRNLAREAVIIMSAKEKGETDTQNFYLDYLKQQKNYVINGTQASSSVFHSKQITVNNFIWIDGFHLGSEIPTYYTRYLATVKENLAVLVTYSAHRSLWKKYITAFNESIATLRLLNVKEAVKQFRANRSKQLHNTSVREYLQGIVGNGEEDTLQNSNSLQENSLANLFNKYTKEITGSLIALLIPTLYFIFKILKKKKSQRSSNSIARRRRRK